MFKTNDPQNRERRMVLRSHSGLPEVLLWQQIKGQKLGVKFRRQYGIGNYILDFYCHEKKLGIELDGKTHDNKESYAYDRHREQFIYSQGVTIIHYLNKDILHNLDGVVADLKNRLQ